MHVAWFWNFDEIVLQREKYNNVFTTYTRMHSYVVRVTWVHGGCTFSVTTDAFIEHAQLTDFKISVNRIIPRGIFFFSGRSFNIDTAFLLIGIFRNFMQAGGL